MTKKGLGRGLDALFQTYEYSEPKKTNDDSERIRQIKIADIDPNAGQPRKSFEKEKLNELAQSISQHGVVQPIIVKPNGNRFTIIAGERRWRAARIANLSKIPAIIKDVDDKEVVEIALIENLQRQDLNDIEEAIGIKTLMDEHDLTQEAVSQRISKSRSAIANSLRLLKLPQRIQQYIIEEKLTSGHARALLSLDDEKKIEIADLIIEKNLSVRQVEKLIQDLSKQKKVKEKNITKPTYLLEIENNLEESLGTRVVISPGKKKGVIEIEYYNNQDLERIISKINE